MSEIRTFIVEHQPVMRQGLRAFLATSGDIRVMGEAGSGEAALGSLGDCMIDVVLLDLDIDGEDGSSVIRRVASSPPGQKVLVATDRRDLQVHQSALLAGARGLVTKDKEGEIFLRAIRLVHGGGLWFERHLLETVSLFSREKRAPSYDALTLREQEIVSLIARGLKNCEIASRLSITPKTVRNHLSSIFGKLGVSDRLALLVHASQLGLVSIRAEGDLSDRPAGASSTVQRTAH